MRNVVRKNVFWGAVLPAAVLLTLILSPAQLRATAAGPTSQVQATVNQVVTLLGDPAYKDRPLERRQKIVSTIGQRFNFSLMSRLALGKTWQQLSDEQRRQFSDLFASLLKNTYIKRIESYSGEQIVFTKERIKKNLALVYSLFKKNNDEYSIIYKLRREGDEWLIYDVVIEGASIVKQYRRQFSRVIADENFDGLMTRLDDKVKLLARKI